MELSDGTYDLATLLDIGSRAKSHARHEVEMFGGSYRNLGNLRNALNDLIVFRATREQVDSLVEAVRDIDDNWRNQQITYTEWEERLDALIETLVRRFSSNLAYSPSLAPGTGILPGTDDPLFRTTSTPQNDFDVIRANIDFGSMIDGYEPVQMTEYGAEYQAYRNQFDFIPQLPSSNGVSSTTCKDYRLTEFGNYDNDGTFFPEHLSQQLNRYPSVDDNLRSKSGNFWTYGTTVDEYGYFKNLFPGNVPVELSYTVPEIYEGTLGNFFTSVERVKIQVKGFVLNPPYGGDSDEREFYRKQTFRAFLEGGEGPDGDVFPSLVTGGKVYTDHTSFVSAFYKQKEAEKLNTPSTCFAKIEDKYNSYIQPYEQLLSNPGVHENTLPNIYAFHLLHEENTSQWFKKLITLQGHNKLRKAIGQGNLSSTTPDEIVGEYFIEYANSYFNTQYNGNYPTLKEKYSRIIVPYEDRLGNARYNDYANLFPMSINIEFSTDQRTRFAEMLSSANLSTRFAEYIAQIVDDESNFLDSWEYGNSRTQRSSNRVIDLSAYIAKILEGDYNVEYDKALYLGMVKDENVDPNDFSIVNIIFSAVFYAKVLELMKEEFRTFNELMSGKPAYSETVMYKICKYKNGEKIQEIYLPNSNAVDVHRYIDTQVKYGQEYEYRIFGYELVVGSEYGYSDLVTNSNISEAIATVLHKPALKLIETELFTRMVAVIDRPPIAPDVLLVPFKGINDTIRCLINNNVGQLTTQPIPLNDSEREAYRAYRILKDLEENEPIEFKSDDTPEQFEIFRTKTAPTKYEDFAGQRLAIIKTGSDSATRRASAAFDDSIRPNQKYYYMFRSVDVHGNISLPSEVYELEIIDDEGVIYPIIKSFNMKEKDNNTPSKSLKRLMKIKPATSQLFFNDEGLEGDTAPIQDATLGLASEKVWGKRFKLRLTSKQTGKKIDINFKFVDKPEV